VKEREEVSMTDTTVHAARRATRFEALEKADQEAVAQQRSGSDPKLRMRGSGVKQFTLRSAFQLLHSR
jgi:hypothetical protein